MEVDAGWRVLVVEDSTVTGRVVESVLRQCGFVEIELFQDCLSALKRMREWPFDLVLCDWVMSPVDGISFLHRVRGDRVLKDVRFILMSAKKDSHWLKLAMDAGADTLITKPFNAHVLKGKVAEILTSRSRKTH